MNTSKNNPLYKAGEIEKLTYGTKTHSESLSENKTLVKAISKVGYYSVEQFENDARSYISAIKDGRMINSIGSVSSSGMSRTMKFLSCEPSKDGGKFWYRQYSCLFLSLGFSQVRTNRDYFRIGGCGMDMVFHTNYTIIHKLAALGFITKDECSTLCQNTPTTI